MSERPLETYAPDSPLATAVRDFCREAAPDPGAAPSWASVPAWQPLVDAGTELWLDTGDIDAARALWCSEFRALTTNNTLLNKEVQKGIYDELVPRAAAVIRDNAPGIAENHVVLETAFVLNAVHARKLVGIFGADVSVELHTDLAHDVAASVAYGRRYHAICPDRFIVKVPLTAAGLVAARQLSDSGIRINFTLGFSARQNLLIARAARPDWCNVFMGRINAFIADRSLGDGQNAGERATAASQRVIAELRASGASPTKQIGASMRGPAQVPGLAGLDVYTMPTAVAQGHLDEPGPVTDGCRSEFPVTFADGIDAGSYGLDVFWNVDAASQAAVDALAAQDVASLDGASVRAALAANGGGSYFPEFDAGESERIASDGKIPQLEPWLADVQSGRTAWDTMLTAAGLASFAADQAALDDRIRGCF